MNTYNLPPAFNEHYKNRYIKFINSLMQTNLDYTEVHHVCPKSLNGTNDVNNLISITARQHFIAHWLLWKAYKTDALTRAFWAMCHQKNKFQLQRYTKINSRTYQVLKKERSILIQNSNKNRWLNKEWASRMKETLSLAASTPAEKERRSMQATINNKKYKQEQVDLLTNKWKDKEWADLTKLKIKQSMAKYKKIIIIDNNEYFNVIDVASKFNICISEVRRRIKSQTPQFINWMYKPPAAEAPMM